MRKKFQDKKKRIKIMIEKLLNLETRSWQGFAGGGQLSNRYKQGSFCTQKEEYMYNFYEPKLE